MKKIKSTPHVLFKGRKTADIFLTWFLLRSTISSLAASARPLFRHSRWTVPPEGSHTNHIRVQDRTGCRSLTDLTSLCHLIEKTQYSHKVTARESKVGARLRLEIYKRIAKNRDTRSKTIGDDCKENVWIYKYCICGKKYIKVTSLMNNPATSVKMCLANVAAAAMGVTLYVTCAALHHNFYGWWKRSRVAFYVYTTRSCLAHLEALRTSPLSNAKPAHTKDRVSGSHLCWLSPVLWLFLSHCWHRLSRMICRSG